MEPRVSRQNLRIGLGIVVGLLVLAIGGGAVFLATFDPNSEKPRIIALVKQATGRDLVLRGKIGLALSLQPTLQVTDVALANPPGFAQPEMATLQRLDLRLRLLPLLSRRIEISKLVLVHPDIGLETNAQGQPNWQFAPARAAPGSAAPASTASGQPSTGQPSTGPQPAGPSTAPTAPGQPSTGQPPAEPSTASTPTGGASAASGGIPSAAVFSIEDIQIQDGTVTYRDDASGTATTLAVQRLTAAANSFDAPVHIIADATYNGAAFSLIADTGSLNRLQDTSARTPWPMKLALQTGAAKLGIDGGLTEPIRGRGYAVTVTGSVPDLAALAKLVPQVKQITLLPLHDVTFNAHLVDQGRPLPEISALTLHAGAADLNALFAGLTLDRLDIDAPALDQPGKVAIAARIGDTPVTVDAKIGAPGMLIAETSDSPPLPVDATLRAGGATLTAKGQIARPAALTGVSLNLTGQIPDLANLAPLARHPLPALKPVSFSGAITDADGGFANGVTLHKFTVTTPDGDLAGDVALRFGARPAVTGNLGSTRLDVDALRAVPVTQPALGQPSGTSPPPNPPAAPSAAPPPLPAARGKPGENAADRPLPWDRLQQADADLTVAIAALHAGGTDYKTVKAHFVLQDGKLHVEPLTADLPTGHLDAKAEADATAKDPTVSLLLHEPGLPLRPLLVAIGQPPTANGNLEIYADLHGAGATPHAIAGSLDGTLGFAMANGTLDNRLLGATLSRILEPLNALDLAGRSGTSDVRCLAARFDFQHGVGTLRSLALNSSLLTMTGGGSVDLRSDRLDLLLEPRARIAGTSLVVPMQVTGPIASPSTRVNRIGTAKDNAGTVAGAIIGDATPLGLLGGLLGADKLVEGSGDVCAGALALARGTTPPAEAAPKSKPSGPAGFLQQFLH